MNKLWIDKIWIEAIIIDGLIENGFINADNVDNIDDVNVNVSKDICYGSYTDNQYCTDIEDAAYMAAYGGIAVVWKHCPWTGEDLILY